MHCPQTKWKDLSEEHRRLREELEKEIEAYVKGSRPGAEDYCPYLIVAPYGSGKTELLSYLCNWCVKNGIYVIYTELKDIVKYLDKVNVGKIHEGDLPEHVEEFFIKELATNVIAEKLIHTAGLSNSDALKLARAAVFENSKRKEGALKELANLGVELSVSELERRIRNELRSKRGVMLIDEIEEAYDSLKNKVKFRTSPLRALFERVIRRKLLFFPVFAFGPSSALMEAAGLIGWRVRTKSIPIVSPTNIVHIMRSKNRVALQEALNTLGRRKKLYEKLLANTLWWLGKGRIGWVNRLIDEGIAEDILNRVINIKKGIIAPETTRYPFSEKYIDTLRTKIVEDISLFNESSYTEIFRSLLDYDESYRTILAKLFPLSVILVGPLPLSEIESVLGIRPSNLKLPRMVCSQEIISKDKLLDNIIRVIRSNRLTESEDTLNDVRKILDIVLDAWSCNDILILNRSSYHKYFEELKDIAMSIALEMYKEDVVGILDKIDIKNIVTSMIGNNESIVVDEGYCAISPSVLVELYPLIMIKPLVACAKTDLHRLEKRVREASPSELLEIGSYIEESLQTTQQKEEPLRVKIYYVPDPKILHDIRPEIINNITEDVTPFIIPVSTSGRNLEKVTEEVERELKNYIDVALVETPKVGPRLALFLTGLIYAGLECPRNLTGLKGVENYILKQYLRNYSKALRDTSTTFYSKLVEVQISVRKSLSQLLADFSYLDEQGYRVIGSGKAEYVWISSTANSKVVDILKNTIDRLAELARAIDSAEAIFNIKVGNVMRGLRLLAEKSGPYLEKASKTGKELKAILERDRLLRSISLVIREIALYRDEDLGKVCNNGLRDFVRKLENSIGEVLRSRGLNNKSSIYTLIAYSLSELVNNKCGEFAIRYKNDLLYNLGHLTTIESHIEGLQKSCKELLNKLNELSIKAPNIENVVSTIVKQAEELQNALKNLRESIKLSELKDLDPYDLVILSEFIGNGIIRSLYEGLSEEFVNKLVALSKRVEDIMYYLDEVNSTFNKLDKEITECVKKLTGKDVKEELRKDLESIFRNNRLEEVGNKLREYINQDYLRSIHRVCIEYNELTEGKNIPKYLDELKDLVKSIAT